MSWAWSKDEAGQHWLTPSRGPEGGTDGPTGYRILDADTRIIEPAEPIEEYRMPADRAKLAALRPLAAARAGQGGNVALTDPGSRERGAAPSAAARGVKDGGTPWDGFRGRQC